MQSVEMLLDPRGHAQVVSQWDALAAAGLPSQSQHQGATNAPHVTIGLAERIDGDAEAALRDLTARLPLEIALGPVVLFEGRRTVVLARLVLPSPPLLALHAEMSEALASCPGRPDHLATGRWVPHVTLAQRMKPGALAEALAVLREHASNPKHSSDRRHELNTEHEASSERAPQRADMSLTARVVELRRWDSEAKRAWTLPDSPPT